MRYHHTQVSYAMLALQLAIAAIVVWRSGSLLFALVLNGLLVALWLVFGRLTTTVDDERITVSFGLFGRPRESFRLADVRSTEKVRTSPLAGWGIRWTLHGRLWNVWGLDAVELRLASGQRFRIGTDEPEALMRALRTLILAGTIGMLPPAPAMAQAAPQATAPSTAGSYLNLQPRRRVPRRPMFQAPAVTAPRPAGVAPGATTNMDARTVVCGTTVLRGAPLTDAGMIVPIPHDGPRPAIRAVDPPLCAEAR